MREAVSDIGAQRQYQSLRPKIGIHEGSCLAVTLNDQQSRSPPCLRPRGLKPTLRRATLSGTADDMPVYEIP